MKLLILALLASISSIADLFTAEPIYKVTTAIYLSTFLALIYWKENK